MLLQADIHADISNVEDLRVSGKDLVDYFCKGLQIGVGSAQSNLDREVHFIRAFATCDYLDRYASLRTRDSMEMSWPKNHRLHSERDTLRLDRPTLGMRNRNTVARANRSIKTDRSTPENHT